MLSLKYFPTVKNIFSENLSISAYFVNDTSRILCLRSVTLESSTYLTRSLSDPHREKKKILNQLLANFHVDNEGGGFGKVICI